MVVKGVAAYVSDTSEERVAGTPDVRELFDATNTLSKHNRQGRYDKVIQDVRRYI